MNRSRVSRQFLIGPVVAAVSAMTLLAGCSAIQNDAKPESAKPTAAPKHCSEAECPALVSPEGDLGPSGVTSANAATTVPKYLSAVLGDLDGVWQDWLTGLNVVDGTAGRQIISPGESFTSKCHDEDDKTVTMGSDYANALFCAVDPGLDGAGNERVGSVILPETTFADIWDGRLMGQRGVVLGDFSAATIVAHEYGHNVMYRLAEAYGLEDSQLPSGNNAELLADCFAGNWGKTVFARDDLSAKEMAQAVMLMISVSDPAPGMGHGTIPERVAAISRGFGKTGDGTPGTCLNKYWPEVLAPA